MSERGRVWVVIAIALVVFWAIALYVAGAVR